MVVFQETLGGQIRKLKEILEIVLELKHSFAYDFGMIVNKLLNSYNTSNPLKKLGWS